MAEESRKDRRKATKREKRKQKRREKAKRDKEEEEAKLNDPEEIRKAEIEEDIERERIERDKKLFEERETLFLIEIEKKKKLDEEEKTRREQEEEEEASKVPHDNEHESDWEYVEDGPPEIIWQGNEIIVKKKKIKVKRKDADQQLNIEESGRPISNPLPPESEPFEDSNNRSVVSSQQVLDNAVQQNPNFGTEQDKAHCPFQIKTGACRFGLRCSRLHFYPDKSCTLLIKNMYNGPGLAFEQDEGLEHTDEEVDRCFEEFYEDVHTEFLKFGEIVNFKVCKNSSFHLRGNLYAHYKSQDSAMLAYQSVNGRYFAGKQVTCEFVGVTKWRVAICGEFMRSRLKTCSRGAACNFIHCFRNPGGDYEWADWDKPPPKYWVQEMASLFGHSQHSSERITDINRRPSKRSQSKESRSSRDHHHEEYDSRRSRDRKTYRDRSRKEVDCYQSKNGIHDSDSDRNQSDCERGEDRHHHSTKGSTSVLENPDFHESRTSRSDSNSYWSDIEKERDRKRNRDRDRDRKREEDIHSTRNGSTPRRKSRDKWDNFNASEFIVEDEDREKDEDAYYKSKKKGRDKLDSANDNELVLHDQDKKGDEDASYKPNGKRSTYKRKSRDSANDSHSMLEDKYRKRDDDAHYNPKEKKSAANKKNRDRWDSADNSDFMLEDKDGKRDEDVHYKLKGKSSSAKKKGRDRCDSAEDIESVVKEKDRKRDGGVYYKHNEKSSSHKRKNRDKWDDTDNREFMADDKDRKRGDDMYYKRKGESSIPKRRNMDKWDSSDDGELMVEEDKSKSRKSSRKSSRHSNEGREFIDSIERQDRWDDKVAAEY